MTGETFHDALARQMVLEVFMREHRRALVFAYDDDRDPIVCPTCSNARSERDRLDRHRSIPNAA